MKHTPRIFRRYTGPRIYRHVSHTRPCRVCGQPDWCSYSSSGEVSCCARINHGADAVSKERWGIYFHPDQLRVLPKAAQPLRRGPTPQPITPAPDQVRAAVYARLIEISPAWGCAETAAELQRRGLPHSQFSRFGALAPTPRMRDELARELRNHVLAAFPDWANQHGRAGLVGVPGFWQERSGSIRLWKHLYQKPLLVIPYRSQSGEIQGCQLRCDEPAHPKYCWLSTPRERRGARLTSPIHFTQALDPHRPVLLTEGALKAETLVAFRPDLQAAAVAGVASSHQALLDAVAEFDVVLAFDNDYQANPQVLRSLAQLLARRFRQTSRRKTTILGWDNRAKGVDDAVRERLPLKELSIGQWLNQLLPAAGLEARKILRQRA